MTIRKKPPTMADIAAEAGVSPMTVSRAFKTHAYVNEQTRKAVMSAAERLGYVLDGTAAGLSSRKTGFVAVTIPSINNGNFADTARGLTEGLRESRLQVLLGYTNYDVNQEERLVGQLLTRRPEAIVVTGGVHTQKCRTLLSNAGVPVIEMWDHPADPINRVVGFSNAEVGALLVNHLVSTGRRKLAFIGGSTSMDTRGHDRRRGFIRELERLGLDSSRLVDTGPPPTSMRAGADAMARILTTMPDTEAVVCVADPAAFGALTECQRRGVVVPGQMAICGFGNYDLSEISVPTLTTVEPHCQQIGQLVASKIAQLLSPEEEDVEVTDTFLSPTLVVRQSTVS